jgi:hypothetical protein
MAQRPSRSALAALLLAAILILPWLAGSPAGAAQPATPHAAAGTSGLSGPLAWLWQALGELLHASPAAGAQATPHRPVLPDAGCSTTPDGRCTSGSQSGAG